MGKTRLRLLAACASIFLATSATAEEQGNLTKPLRIGILNDRSGPYADASGEGSAIAARLAADEFGNKVLGVPIEIVVGDHAGKPDLGTNVARRWFDVDGVDAIADIANSGVGLAVTALAKERNRIVLNNSVAGSFTGKACTPVTVQWSYNSFASGKALATALLKQNLKTWFIIAVDYAYGQALSADLKRMVEAGGGKIVGEARHPLGTADFSSFLLQAQASGAQVIALANSGADLVTTIKQANEFGMTKSQKLVSVSAINLSEIEALGLDLAQGLLTTSAFEWNRSDETRQWTKRFVEKAGRLPTADQAATYSEVKHYLQAVAAAKTVDALPVMAKMRDLPVKDAFADNGHLREDGQMVHDFFLVRAKTPAESTEKGDYFAIVQTVPSDEAFQPLSESTCPLVKKN